MQVLSVSAVLFSLCLCMCICFADAQQVCPPDEFLCSSNGTCLSSNLLCDGVPDCLDESDEANCPYDCFLNGFPCINNGTVICIPIDYYCDGFEECPDGSDEDCIYVVCPLDTFPCVDLNGNFTCLPMDFRCDGIYDCLDNSDEVNCTNCTLDAFPCVSNETITCHPIILYCDGSHDCPDGSDEDNCPGCPPNQFECATSGRCFPKDYYCDTVNHCPDNSDEVVEDCGDCPISFRECEDGECIPSRWWCDGINDCSNRSDERQCVSPPPPPTCTATPVFFPYGRSHGDIRGLPEDDFTYSFITGQSFPYFGLTYMRLQIHTNGILSFQQPFMNYGVSPFPIDNTPPLIAPFWDDVNIAQFGNIFYRETNKHDLLLKVENYTSQLFTSEDNFSPTFLIIITWCDVAELGSGMEANTFQVVLSTDGEKSFVFFIYGDLQWGNPTIGFNAGDGTRFLTISRSSQNLTEIQTNSNMGVPGLYVFRADLSVVIPNGVRFGQEMYTVVESQSFVRVCAVISEGLQFGGTVILSTTEATASRDEDYRAITRNINFNATVIMGCVQIPIFSDNTVEGPERFLVHLSATVVGFELDMATIEIVDDDVPAVKFLQPLYIVNELSERIRVCAITDAQLQRSITLVLQTEDDTAKEVADYEPINDTVVFTNGNEKYCVNVKVKDDSVDEDTEAFSVNVRILGFNDSVSSTTLIDIIDDDIPTFLFSQAAYAVDESVGIARICAMTHNTELERTVTLNIRTSDRTATGGSDYTGISRDLTFDADHNISCADIVILPDQLHENNETFSVSLSGPSDILTHAVPSCEDSSAGANENTIFFTFAMTDVTILDDDAVGIGFEQPVYIVREDEHSVTVKAMLNVTLGETRIEAVTEYYDVTATVDSDYSVISSGLVFDSGESRMDLAIQILTNLIDENTESFLVTLISNDTHSDCPTATVVILDTYSLYPYGDNDSTLTDFSSNHSPQLLLQQNFTFFGENESIVYVNTNGIVSFQLPFDASTPTPFPFKSTPLIAPFWNDNGMQSRGIYYRETNDSILLQRAHEEVQLAFPHIWNFFPTILFIATWEDLPTGGMSFQVVMATDGKYSFVIFIHGNMQWESPNTIVGFNAGDGIRHVQIIQSSGPSRFIPGVYIHRVDQADIIGHNNCSAGEVRLVEGATQGEGIVEVCSGNKWERQHVDNDTSVRDICRELGFLGGEIVVGRGTSFASSGNSNYSSSDGSGALAPPSSNGDVTTIQVSGSGSLPEGSTSGGMQSGSDSIVETYTLRCALASVSLEENVITAEDDGFTNICVNLGQLLERTLFVTLLTAETGSAEAPDDFNATSMVLTFGPAATGQQQCANVTIFDDAIHEENETFLVLLTTVEQAVNLSRQYALVTIIDNDEPIGMIPSSTSGISAITSTVNIIPTATTHQPTSFISDSTTLLTVTPDISSSMSPTISSGPDYATIAIVVSLVLVIICVVLVVAIIVVLRWKIRRKTLKISMPKLALQLQLEKNVGDKSFLERARLEHGAKSPYALFEQALMSTMEETGTLKKLSREMIIPSRNIDLKDSLGQGEFGIVYKGHLLELQRKRSDSSRDNTASRLNVVAVKTLKGFFDQSQVIEMLRESIKMRDFDHPNVLNLIGVCLDGGPAPYIVLPFMANGSLLSYLRKERPNLLLGENVDQEQVSTISKRLLDMCIQIAKGMDYLASRNFVHRDLAARNCMMDAHFTIKVADFGLSENTYAKTYFRQGQETAVKLPIKWLALESMIDGVFSEKTDVWAFGVTCWEVHSAGKTPYPGVAPMSLPGLLENGHRLEKPNNAACGGEMYSIMLSCWNPNPEERPPFSELVKKISGILEPLADYMDFSSFALSSQDVGTSPADGANMEIAYECETATRAATEATDAGLSSSVEVSQESAV